MFYGYGTDKSIKSPKLDLTLPSNNLNEVSLPEMEASPNRSDMDSGHLYGFMILLMDRESNATQFERVNSYYGFDRGFDDISFFGDPNLSYVPTEYFFCVPPRSISLVEPSTTTIQPTMGRTYVKEHQGILLRQLAVSGTTGFRPSQYISNSLGGIDGRGIPINERTGYFNFIQLRNLFRYYQTLISNPQYISALSGKNLDVVMLWVNFHESEFWECEPSGFTTSRDASRPTMFNYDITCTLLRKYDSLVFKPIDGIAGYWIAKAFEYFNEILGDIQKYLNFVTNYYVSTTTVARSLLNNATFASNKVIDMAYRLAGTAFGVAMIPAFLILQAREAWNDLRNKCESSITSNYKALGSLEDVTEPYYKDYQEASYYDMLAKYFTDLYAAKRSCESRTSLASQRYPSFSCDSLEYPDFNKGKTSVGPSSAARYIVDQVHDGETIYTIAKRTLGNENRFEEIVAANNLVPPYVSTYEIEKGVLVPGDEILIPVDNADLRVENNAVLPTQPEEFVSVLKDANLARFLYGVDVKVTFAGYGGTGYPKVDFVVENGDLATVEGSDNFLQAMAIKVNTERGSLKLHPWFGRMFLVGLKSSVAVIAATAVAFKHCILTDPRVAEVDNVKIRLDGDTLDIKLRVTGQRYLTAIPVVVREKI